MYTDNYTFFAAFSPVSRSLSMLASFESLVGWLLSGSREVRFTPIMAEMEVGNEVSSVLLVTVSGTVLTEVHGLFVLEPNYWFLPTI